MSAIATPNSQSGSQSKGELPTRCHCDLPLANRVSGTDKNPGRKYLQCVNKNKRGKSGTECNFFAWVDEYDLSPSSQSTSSITATPYWSHPTSSHPTSTPMKRRRSESPTPTRVTTAPSGVVLAGPPTIYSATPSSRPLYPSSPSPTKKSKKTHTRSEDELWGDGSADESIGTSLKPMDSISQVLPNHNDADEVESFVYTPKKPPLKRGDITPVVKHNSGNGLVTPISITNTPSTSQGSKTLRLDGNVRRTDTLQMPAEGPVLEYDPENPFVTAETLKGKGPMTPRQVVAKQPSVPQTPQTPSGLRRTPSTALLTDFDDFGARFKHELAIYENRRIADQKSIDYKSNKIKELMVQLAEKEKECETLKLQLAKSAEGDGELEELKLMVGKLKKDNAKLRELLKDDVLRQ